MMRKSSINVRVSLNQLSSSLEKRGVRKDTDVPPHPGPFQFYLLGQIRAVLYFVCFIPPPPTPYLPTPQGSSKPVFLTTVSHLGVSRQLRIKVFVCLL